MVIAAETLVDIGGSPEVVEGAAAVIAAGATTMSSVGEDVGAHGDTAVASWTGTAGEAAHERIRHLAQRTDVGAEVVSELPDVLSVYAAQLRAAQAEHAIAVTAAQSARASLAAARSAVEGASAMDDGPQRAQSMRLSGHAEALAAEDVAASSHAIDAAVARERVANTVAARAVRALTTRLSGMDPAIPGGGGGASPRPVESAGQDRDEGRPLTWIERTAGTTVELAAGAADTAYLVPQTFGYGILRAAGSDHEEAVDRLQRDRQRLADRVGVDVESSAYEALNLRDDWDDFQGGTAGGGWREAVGAGGELAWQGTAGLAAFGLGTSPFESVREVGREIDDAHDWLEDEWGAQTDTSLYRGIVLAGALVPSRSAKKSMDEVAEAVEGDLAGGAKRAGSRSGGSAGAREAAEPGASTPTTAAGPGRAGSPEALAFEDAASRKMATRAGRSVDEWRSTPTVPGRAGHAPPAGGRVVMLGDADITATAHRISEGHSYAKHVVQQAEFPGVQSGDELKAVIADVVAHGEVKEIRPKVYAYWKDGVVVINNPGSVDLGTAFIPEHGYNYFYKQEDYLR